jgi:hypothetical protein
VPVPYTVRLFLFLCVCNVRRTFGCRAIVVLAQTTNDCMPGRFRGWHQNTDKRKVAKQPKPPWAISKDKIAWVESITADLKTPSSWPPVRRFFSDLGHMKTSETLLFAGDVGAYFLRHMDIDPKYKALFIRLVRVIERLSHTHTHAHAHTHALHAHT